MLDLAVIDDGDRLEPAMRMLADAAPLGCRREIMRPRIVEQQEGADVPIPRVIGKERADRETIAHPMAAFVAVENGRAASRERGWQYVEISGVAVQVKKKN